MSAKRHGPMVLKGKSIRPPPFFFFQPRKKKIKGLSSLIQKISKLEIFLSSWWFHETTLFISGCSQASKQHFIAALPHFSSLRHFVSLSVIISPAPLKKGPARPVLSWRCRKWGEPGRRRCMTETRQNFISTRPRPLMFVFFGAQPCTPAPKLHSSQSEPVGRRTRVVLSWKNVKRTKICQQRKATWGFARWSQIRWFLQAGERRVCFLLGHFTLFKMSPAEFVSHHNCGNHLAV